MRRAQRSGVSKAGFFFTLALMLLSTTCAVSKQSLVNQSRQAKSMIPKDINKVLKDHEQELMSVPGVVGVYVGLLPDGKSPCLKVMVVKKTAKLKKRIPASLEAYPVLIEESGVIRPLSGNSR